jgi:hypothetical protein
MTDKIKLLEEIIESCTDKYGDNRNEIAKALFLLNEIKAAINYTHSCTELRDKEPTLVYNGRDRFGKEIWLNKDKT